MSDGLPYDEDEFPEVSDFPRGCAIGCLLSLIIWICIGGFVYWIYYYGITID